MYERNGSPSDEEDTVDVCALERLDPLVRSRVSLELCWSHFAYGKSALTKALASANWPPENGESPRSSVTPRALRPDAEKARLMAYGESNCGLMSWAVDVMSGAIFVCILSLNEVAFSISALL